MGTFEAILTSFPTYCGWSCLQNSSLVCEADSFCMSLSWRMRTEITQRAPLTKGSFVYGIRPELVQSKPQARRIQTSAPTVLLCSFTPIAMPSLAMERSQVSPMLSHGQGLPPATCLLRPSTSVEAMEAHGCCTNTNIKEPMHLFVFEIQIIAPFWENNSFWISLGQSSKVAICQRIC